MLPSLLYFYFLLESKATKSNENNQWEIKTWIHPYLTVKFWIVWERFLQLSILGCSGPQSLNTKRVQGKYHACFMIIGFCESHEIQIGFSWPPCEIVSTTDRQYLIFSWVLWVPHLWSPPSPSPKEKQLGKSVNQPNKMELDRLFYNLVLCKIILFSVISFSYNFVWF